MFRGKFWIEKCKIRVYLFLLCTAFFLQENIFGVVFGDFVNIEQDTGLDFIIYTCSVKYKIPWMYLY